jgi:hypothetical protein
MVRGDGLHGRSAQRSGSFVERWFVISGCGAEACITAGRLGLERLKIRN